MARTEFGGDDVGIQPMPHELTSAEIRQLVVQSDPSEIIQVESEKVGFEIGSDIEVPTIDKIG